MNKVAGKTGGGVGSNQYGIIGSSKRSSKTLPTPPPLLTGKTADPHTQQMLEITSDPGLSSRRLSAIADDCCCSFHSNPGGRSPEADLAAKRAAAIVAHPNCTPNIIDKLMSATRIQVITAAASTKNPTNKQQDAFIRLADVSATLAKTVVQQPWYTERYPDIAEHYKEMAVQSPHYRAEALLRYGRWTKDTIVRIDNLKSLSMFRLNSLYMNRFHSPDVMRHLYKEGPDNHRAQLVRQKNVPIDVLMNASAHRDRDIREVVIQDPRLTDEHVSKMLQQDLSLSMAVLRRKRLPMDVIDTLLRQNPPISTTASRHPSCPKHWAAMASIK